MTHNMLRKDDCTRKIVPTRQKKDHDSLLASKYRASKLHVPFTKANTYFEEVKHTGTPDIKEPFVANVAQPYLFLPGDSKVKDGHHGEDGR